MPVIHCEINKISQLNPDMHQIELAPSSEIKFKAGQYLNLLLPDNKKNPYSIANSPSQKNIVIQVESSEKDRPSSSALSFCTENQEISVEAGLGNAYFQSPGQKPIILFAAGSGFSYVKSIADHLAETNHQAPVKFYWGVRHENGLYAIDEIKKWEKQSSLFKFIPVVKSPSDSWPGRRGSLLQALLNDVDDLSEFHIYLAGRFDLMPEVRRALLDQAAQPENMFCDAFDYM